MKGSELAGGARSAAFKVEGQDEQIHDLKTLTREQFCEKYVCDKERYGLALPLLDTASQVPQFEPRKKISTVAAVKPAEFKATVKIPEKTKYAGEALGNEVLVIRTEREHSSQLIIPESAKTKEGTGFIISHGPEAKRAIAAGGVGSLVIFDQFAAYGKEIDLVDSQGIPRQHLLLNDVDVQLRLTRVPVSQPS